MPLVTCGLSDEGAIAAEIQFSAIPEIVVFDEDIVESDFNLSDRTLEFDQEIKVINFEIDIIRVEECSIN